MTDSNVTIVELYDTLNDPFELENLADDPARAATRKRLENAIAAWMRQQNDGGIATEHEALDHMNPEIVERIRQRYGEDALPR